MKSWIPCYSLISVGIFKFFSWPPSEAAGLKRDLRNKGKKVKPLQIPPPTSSFAVSAPLICVASHSWGDTGTEQWQISYWACPGQSRGLNGLQGWQEKVIEAFAGGLGKEKGEWRGVPHGRSISELRTCWWWNCYFLPKVKNPNWYMEQKNGISYSRGQGSHTMETKGKKCRKWKDFIPISCFIWNGGWRRNRLGFLRRISGTYIACTSVRRGAVWRMTCVTGTSTILLYYLYYFFKHPVCIARCVKTQQLQTSVRWNR